MLRNKQRVSYFFHLYKKFRSLSEGTD